jgi:hypothetical protein
MVKAVGVLNVADVAAPLTLEAAVEKSKPVPANVDTVLARPGPLMKRRRALPLSPMRKPPLLSGTRPTGLLKSASVTEPSVLPVVPHVPASVITARLSMLIRRTQ